MKQFLNYGCAYEQLFMKYFILKPVISAHCSIVYKNKTISEQLTDM